MALDVMLTVILLHRQSQLVIHISYPIEHNSAAGAISGRRPSRRVLDIPTPALIVRKHCTNTRIGLSMSISTENTSIWNLQQMGRIAIDRRLFSLAPTCATIIEE
jgi:hypothetical protein